MNTGRSSSPDKTAKLLAKAIEERRAGRLSAAETLYKKILRHHPDHLDARYLLGTLYAEAGKPKTALPLLLRAAEMAPRSPSIRNNLANVHRMLGDRDAAAAAYGAALDIDGRFAPALLSLADLRLAEDDLDGAETLFGRLIAVDPNQPEARFHLARLLANRNETESAREHLRRYMELDPDDALGGALLRARLDGLPPPEGMPPALVRSIYRDKAARWDIDIKRPGLEYLGPRLVADALASALPNATALAVLDLGCGTGLCGEELRSAAASLVGVDLSMNMLEKARERKLYDELIEADVIACMEERTGTFDLVTAAGLAIFFGDLQPLLTAVAGTLNRGGTFIVTLYRSADADVELRHNLHFAHSRTYVESAAAAAGLTVRRLDDVIHEFDYDVPQAGWIAVLGKP